MGTPTTSTRIGKWSVILLLLLSALLLPGSKSNGQGSPLPCALGSCCLHPSSKFTTKPVMICPSACGERISTPLSPSRTPADCERRLNRKSAMPWLCLLSSLLQEYSCQERSKMSFWLGSRRNIRHD